MFDECFYFIDTLVFQTPIAVNLSVDPKGYYLICLNKVTKVTDQSLEIESVAIKDHRILLGNRMF